MADQHDAYSKLIGLLDRNDIKYRLIDHEPEGQTELVSQLRGNKLSQAAKCMIIMVKIGKKVTRYLLGVIPGDTRIDFNAIKRLKNATYVSFASPNIAEQLAGSVAGTILPFSDNPELELVVDPILLENKEIFFNAGRLDRSMVLNSSDYLALAKPSLKHISIKNSVDKNVEE